MRKVLLFNVLIASVVISAATGTGCYYDNEEELYGSVGCDTTSMSYLRDIVPILDKNCYNCHAAATYSVSNAQFDSYTLLKKYVDSGALTDRTSNSNNPMPPSGIMNACNINKIKAWVQAGALDN